MLTARPVTPAIARLLQYAVARPLDDGKRPLPHPGEARPEEKLKLELPAQPLPKITAGPVPPIPL